MRVALIALILLTPTLVSAEVVINEIMYDIPGTDTDREWIEVQNTGAEAVDLSTYKFFEANTNHGLTVSQGSAVIASGGYAVIADVPTNFLADWPGFSGVIFDSSFSLGNTGETLALKNADGVEVSSVSYMSEWGAVGDGNSLQKASSGFLAAPPTPGAQNASVSSAPPPSTGSNSTPPPSSSTGSSSSGSGTTAAEKTITASIIGPRAAVVGADAVFEARATGLEGAPLENASFTWSFGDGSTGHGQKVTHRFSTPGSYVVYLDVGSGKYSTTARVTVEAFEVPLTITAVTDQYVEIHNAAEVEIDIGGWWLTGAGVFFHLPTPTTVLPKKSLRFSHSTTGLPVTRGNAVTLAFPTGTGAITFEPPAVSVQPSNHAATQPVPIAVPATAAISAPEVTASVAQAEIVEEAVTQSEDFSNNMFVWVGALVLLIGIAVAGVYLAGKEKKSAHPADEYTIVE